MKIVNVGYNYRHPKDFTINRPYGSGDYILLLLRSPAYFILDGKRQVASPDSVIFFKKGTPQIYGAQNCDYINDWIHFELDEDEEKMITDLDISFDCILPITNSTIISSLIKSMFNEIYSQNIYKENSLALYFKLTVYKISEEIMLPNLKKENQYYSKLSSLRNEIYLNPEKDWSVESICKRTNLSRSYIQHMYKSFFGESITADITHSRMEYAKFLLSGTDMTINSISRLCGYNNDVHFMRQFKKLIGITPSQFKKQVHITKEELENLKNKNPFCL